MATRTGRGSVVVAVLAAVALGAAVLFLLDRPEIGAALASLVLLGVVGLLLDLRRRLAALTRGLRAQSTTLSKIETAADDRAARAAEHVEAVERRLLTAVARVQTEAREEHERARVRARGAEKKAKQLDTRVQGVPRDVDSLLQLQRLIEPRGLLPTTNGWAMDARSMLEVAALIRRVRPSQVVELGSGTSTIWLGYLLEGIGGRLVTLEHLPEYAAVTAESIADNVLGETVTMRVSPLEPREVDGVACTWYAESDVADLAGIDVLLVDGPPQRTGKHARHPALPVLLDRLSPEAWIVLDDATRTDEQETVERWLAEVPGLEVVPTSADDVAILHRVRPTEA